MGAPAVPDWLSTILLILSVVSFLPQLLRTVARKNSAGISVCYTLLNLVSATEQFTLAFIWVVYADEPDFFVHKPVTSGDWINLAQTAVVALFWLVLFAVCLHFPADHRDASRGLALGAYMAFLLVSIVPVLSYKFNPRRPGERPGEHDEHRWSNALFFFVHLCLLNWLITAFILASLYYQARETLSRPPSQTLSISGLAAQAVVFALLAVSWVFRVQYPYNVTWGLLDNWYVLVGWAAVDNAVFALVQAVLLGITVRYAGRGGRLRHGETEPLLGS